MSRDEGNRPADNITSILILLPPSSSLPDKYASQFGSGNQYAYYHDEDETTFHLVDTVRVTKPAYQRGRFRGNMRNMR